MAPIQNEDSYEDKESSAKSSRYKGSRKRSSWDSFLPITRRGRFFQDSFFSDIHKDFDASVREVLDRWHEKDHRFRDSWDDSDFRHSDIMSRYRKLRSRNLRDENQAVTVTSDDTSHKIILDVHDFMNGDVVVKVLDEEELLVEGQSEKGGGSSSRSSQNFKRYFTLPKNTDMTAIMSVMSSDGILTITAPKVKNEPVNSRTSQDFLSSSASSRFRGDGGRSLNQMESENSRSHAYSDANCDSLRSRRERHSSWHSDFDSMGTSRRRRDSWDSFLPLTRRRRSFQDSFFSDIHDDFDASVRRALDRWDDSDLRLRDFWDDDDFSHSGFFGRSRHRSRNHREDGNITRGGDVSSDIPSHKIVLDMHAFLEKDVKIRFVGERELVVEGRSSLTSRSFRRQFTLPESTDMAAITSVMSSDGILTITAPQMRKETLRTSTNIPVSVRESRETSTQSTTSSSSSENVRQETSRHEKRFAGDHEENERERFATENTQLNCVNIPFNYTRRVDRDRSLSTESNISRDSCLSTDSSRHSRRVVDAQGRMDFEEKSERTETNMQNSSTVGKETESHKYPEHNRTSNYRSEGGSWVEFLPITRRGNFSQDSFFSDIRQDFDASVRDVLSKWNDTDRWENDASRSDVLNSYRRLRSRNMREENQACTVTSDNNSQRIVLDVHDFMGGDVQVKVVDERELLVEGRVEKREEGRPSLSLHSFRRRFVLPESTDMTAITSVVSSDGILTITAPQVREEAPQNTPTRFVKSESIQESTVIRNSTPTSAYSTAEESVSSVENVNVNHNESECTGKRTYENKTIDMEDREIPVKIKIAKSKSAHDANLSTQYATSEDEGFNLSETADLESTMTKKSSKDDSYSVQEENRSTSQTESQNTSNETFPVTRGGSFIQDSYFSDIRQDFDAAARKVLKEYSGEDVADDLSLSHSDILERYRGLRSRNLKEENQVFAVTSDNTCFKIVLDVHEFLDGDMKLKVMNEKEIVVEGKVEMKEEGSSAMSWHSFRRGFSLPDQIDLSAISSIISSEGILTITAPRLEVKIQEHEVHDTVNVEKIQDSKIQNSEPPTIDESINASQQFEYTNEEQLDGINTETEVKSAAVVEENQASLGDESQISTDSLSTTSRDDKLDYTEGQNEFKEASQTSDSSVDEEVESEEMQRQVSMRRNIHRRRGSCLMRETFENNCMFAEEHKRRSLLSSIAEDNREGEVSEEISETTEKEDANTDSQESLLEESIENHNNTSYTHQKSELCESTFQCTSTEKAKSDASSFIHSDMEAQNTETHTEDSPLPTIRKDIKEKESAESSETLDFKVAQETNSQTTPSTFTKVHSSVKADEEHMISDSSEKKCFHESQPITRKENFFQDSFFFDIHQDFKAALREVLNKWGEVSFKEESNLRSSDVLEHYRQLRSRDLKDDNQAFIVTSDKTCQKIVLDVHDFMSGDIKVKVEDEDLVVEGRVERREEGSSSMASHSFRRLFSLARNTDITAITSVMSADGILTITAPIKDNQEQARIGNESQEKVYEKMSTNNSERIATIKSFPITKKGLFFYDYFFRDSRKDYQRAVQEVLTRWGQESSFGDEMTCYRELRARNLRENNQAVTSTEDERCYKFILDVQDFMNGEISVKAVDERELVVEGHLKKMEEGSPSTIKFLRRFSMSGDIRMDAVTSVMSSDGVLIISVPKMEFEANKTIFDMEDDRESEALNQIRKWLSESSSAYGKDCSENSVTRDAERALHDTVSAQDSSVRSSRFSSLLSDETQKQKHSSIHIEDSDDLKSCQAGAASTSSKKFSDEYEDYLMSKDMSTEEEDFGTFGRRASRYQVSYESDEEQEENGGALRFSKETENFNSDYDKDRSSKVPSFSTETKFLHITRKDLFADDFFFMNVRHSFSEAVKEVLEKANEWTSRSDALKNYRSLRQRNLKLENQAVGVSEDHHSHMIVMDVYDFMGGDVTVQLVKGKELLVEGQAERLDGSRVSRVSFSRRFSLPDLVDRDAIACAMASDGVLAIISRKGGNPYLSAREFSSERKSYHGRSWEDKNAKTLDDSQGFSSRRYSSGSRSRFQHSYANEF